MNFDGSMRVKISNDTSFLVSVSSIIESETDLRDHDIISPKEVSIKPSDKSALQILDISPLETGENILMRIKLSLSGSIPETEENLYARIRLNGGALGIKVLHSVGSTPYGSLSPEQPWHSGYANVCTTLYRYL